MNSVLKTINLTLLSLNWYFSNLILHFHKVGGPTGDRFNKARSQIEEILTFSP